MVEDSEDDALLLVRELERQGFEPRWRRVETAAELEAALEEGGWDVVLADYRLGDFDAPQALALVQRHDPDLPVIVVSGSSCEEEAVEIMRLGARDYFRKDSLALLGAALERELAGAGLRSAQRAAERELRLVWRALEASANAVVITDRDGTILWTNPAFARLTGYDRGEAVGQNPRLLKSGQHPEEFYRRMWETILAGEVWRGEVVNRRKDGSLYTGEMTITPVTDAAGEISHFVAIHQDVSGRKRIEAERDQARSMLLTVLDTIPQRVFWKDREGRYLGCNRAFAEDAGRDDPRQVIGRTDLELDWAPTAERYRADDRRVLESGEALIGYEEPQELIDGTVRWLRTSKVPLRDAAGEIVGVLGTYEDITEWKAMEEALRESEERFRKAFRASPDALTITRLPDGLLVDVNEGFERITGWTREEVVGRTTAEISAWADPAERARILEAIQKEGQVRGMEASFRMRDGSVRVGSFSAVVTEIGGEPHMLAIIRDVTERKAMEQALRESEARYRGFFEADLTADYFSTVDGRLVDCNPAFVEMFGFASREEALATPVEELYPEAWDRQAFLDRLRRQRVIRGEKTRYRRRDGTLFNALEGVVGLFDEGGELTRIQGFLLDLTEMEQLQAQLLRAQKLESVGRLAAGVAHDFNNLLQAMENQLELLHRMPLEEKAKRRVAGIDSAVDRARRLTRQLLAFTRQQPLKKEPLELNALMADLLKMLRRLVGEDLELAFTPAGRDLPLVADGGQIEQVVTNLVVNARDATPPGGRITVATARIEADSGFRAEHPWAEAEAYAALSVADTGCGMPPEVRERIFDPFFTTKERGRGTGLGLATVFGIVTQHGGMVEVESEEGRGSTFTVYLPLAVEAAATSAVTGERPPLEGGEGRLVLFAEDEPELARVGRVILETAGFEVLVARDGEEALRLFEVHRGRVAVAVLDVMLPRLNGYELSRRIHAMEPELPVLFASGYSGDALEERIGMPPEVEVILKPYRPGELVRRIVEELDRGGTGGER